MGFNERSAGATSSNSPAEQTLADLANGQSGILSHLDLPEELSRRLMELGFLPGTEITPARTAPGGGPRVFRVDGSEIALRRETASRLYLRRAGLTKAAVA